MSHFGAVVGTICSKVSYITRAFAKKAAKRLKSAGKGNRSMDKKLEPYLCPKCTMWHLTSNVRGDRNKKQ